MRFIEETVSSFHCYFNFGKSKTEKLLAFCQPAVEKYIFNKVYSLLASIYEKRYAKENDEFIQRQHEIRRKMSVKQIMDFLGIIQKFRGPENETVPFRYTVGCINKVSSEICPKDKFDTLMRSSLELRNYILEYTNGKVNSLFI